MQDKWKLQIKDYYIEGNMRLFIIIQINKGEKIKELEVQRLVDCVWDSLVVQLLRIETHRH